MPESPPKYKILSGFQLKYIAAILMALDHIHNTFQFTGVIPEWFSMLGRLSAPLFLFCLIEGFSHTRSRKKYFFTIYIIAIGMGLIQYLFIVTGITRPDGFYPQNQILSTFSILLVIFQGFDWCEEKRWIKGLCAVFVPLILSYLAAQAGRALPCSLSFIKFLNLTILPIHSLINDGGTLFIILGIPMYVLRNHRRWQVAAFTVSLILLYAVIPLVTIPDFTMKRLFTDAYEWMGILAVIPMLLYNGERGQGSKKFFYWFYPAHIYILYVLSWGLYFVIYR